MFFLNKNKQKKNNKTNGINKPVLLKSPGWFFITQRWTRICQKTLNLFQDHTATVTSPRVSTVSSNFHKVEASLCGPNALDSNHSTAQWVLFPWDGWGWRQASLIHTFHAFTVKVLYRPSCHASKMSSHCETHVAPVVPSTDYRWASGVLNTSRSE